MNDTTKVAKSHSHCQNCVHVSRLQSLLCRTVHKAAEAADGREQGQKSSSSPRPDAEHACALNQPLQNRLQAKIAQRLIFV